MDSATGTLIGGISIGFLGLTTALTTGLLKLRTDNKTLAIQVELNRAAIAQKEIELTTKREADENSVAHQLREELRADNKEMRLQLSEQDKHINELSLKIDQLTRDVRENREGREKAENEVRECRKTCEESVAEAAMWKAKYEGERDVSALLSNLYDVAIGIKPPDVALLTTIDTRLRDTGYLESSPHHTAPASLTPGIPGSLTKTTVDTTTLTETVKTTGRPKSLPESGQ